jgi:hypothetical protein
MPLDTRIKQIEANSDAHSQALRLWQIPFQAVISQLFFTIEMVDAQGRGDTAMDFASRLSYIYPLVKERAQQAPLNSTVNSLTGYINLEMVQDINFLIAYAHLSLLMPQYHRRLYRLSEIDARHLRLEFKDKAAEQAEIIDRVLSYISLQMVVTYRDAAPLSAYLQQKITKDERTLTGQDFQWISRIKDFMQKYTFNIKAVPDAVFEASFGVTYAEYYAFIATFRAFCEFYLQLGKSFHAQIDQENPKASDDEKEGEYMEWTACCLTKNILGWVMALSGLNREKLQRITAFYLNIYSDSTADGFTSEAYCGDGYFPPLVWMEDHLLFSPHACKYMLTVNNLLYSFNKNHEREFADQISHHLEPCLINQLDYIFQIIPGIQLRQNVDYGASEVDLIVYAPTEKIALCFQVKATIAPDSARTVRRVEQRALEGIGQIRTFENLSAERQEAIIQNSFGNTDTDITFLHFLTVRSCAGSAEIWRHNADYPITNYSLLAYLLAKKSAQQSWLIAAFKEEVLAVQQELVASANPEITEETLVINGESITFPDVKTTPGFMIHIYTEILKVFPDFEQVC